MPYYKQEIPIKFISTAFLLRLDINKQAILGANLKKAAEEGANN